MGLSNFIKKELKSETFGRLFRILPLLFLFFLPYGTYSQELENISPVPGIKIESLGSNMSVLGDFVVGPGKFDASLNPGDSKLFILNVTNRMGDERAFKIEIEDFTGSRSSDQTVILLGSERGPYSLRDYIEVPANEFSLRHGEKASIPITISIPYDEEPGGRYGSVVISTVSKPAEKDSGEIRGGAAIISRIGTLFFVRIPGAAEESGFVHKFQTKAGKKLFINPPVSFEILFDNAGSVHLAPYGEIRINNILGKEVDVIEIDPWFAMPDSLRLREVSWEKDWVFGLYTAHASINRSYRDIIDEKDFTFLVLPWKPLLTFLVLVFILVLFVRFVSKKFEFRRKPSGSNK